MRAVPNVPAGNAPSVRSIGAEAVNGSQAREGGVVLRQTLAIRNSRGLHARAAAKLVTLAERFSACLHVSRDGQRVPACSIMGLMMLGAGQGSTIEIEAEAPTPMFRRYSQCTGDTERRAAKLRSSGRPSKGLSVGSIGTGV